MCVDRNGMGVESALMISDKSPQIESAAQDIRESDKR
jgi:hypothetical protein